MEELIFFGLIIIFSILDGLARKKKGQSGGLPETEWEPAPGERRGGEGPGQRTASRPPGPPLPTYDDDPSYDDRWAGREWDDPRIPGAPRPEYTRPYEPRGDAAPTTSEGMVPADLWAEIGALARGERTDVEAYRPPEAEEEPTSPHPVPAPVPPPAALRRPLKVAESEHAIHRAHLGFGTDPSSRAPAVAPRTSVEEPHADALAVRRMLIGGGSALRQAVILQEVLGKPVSLRNEEEGQ